MARVASWPEIRWLWAPANWARVIWLFSWTKLWYLLSWVLRFSTPRPSSTAYCMSARRVVKPSHQLPPSSSGVRMALPNHWCRISCPSEVWVMKGSRTTAWPSTVKVGIE